MKVLIIGGGIGGLALASFLSRSGKEVTLVERSAEWKNIGFGVTIWGIGRKVLANLGIDEELSKFGHPVGTVQLIASNTKPIITIDFKKFDQFGGQAMIVPRAKLHELLLHSIPPSATLLNGVEVLDIVQEGGNRIHVTLSNGRDEIFDLVVGAEGVHSDTRERISPNSEVYYNWSAIVFWMPESVVHPRQTLCISKTNQTLCFYPTKERTFIAIAKYGLPEQRESAEEFIKPFIPYLYEKGWSEADIDRVLAEARSYYMDDMRYIRMEAWSKGNLTLLGDARHAFVPIIGMGANLALEDAQVLAEELARVDSSGIAQALQAYAARRTPRINRVRRISRFIEPWFNAHSRIIVAIRNAVIPYVPRSIIERMFISVLKEKI